MDIRPQRLAVRYRPMVLADVPRVHEIDRLSFSMPWSERSFRFEVTENRNSLVLVAEEMENGRPPEIIGMTVIWVIIDEAHIATIATDPEHRGKGIGRGLLARGLLTAYERGARLAYLEVRRGNLVAQEMYKKFGFHVAGERLRYYQDNNEDALLMTLDPIKPDLLQQLAE
jgi:[ribosomal protein S18]-alanine N-acetyltransferase